MGPHFSAKSKKGHEQNQSNNYKHYKCCFDRVRSHFPRSLMYRIPVTLLPHPHCNRNLRSSLLRIGILRTCRTCTFLLQSCTTSALSFLQLASSLLSLQPLSPLGYTGIFFQKRMAIQISLSAGYLMDSLCFRSFLRSLANGSPATPFSTPLMVLPVFLSSI